MSTQSPTLTFSGSAAHAYVYGEGELVVQAKSNANGSRTFLYALDGKSPVLDTIVKIELTALAGTVKLSINGGGKKTLKKNGRATIPAGAKYTLEGANAALTGTTKPGPGFGAPISQQNGPR